VDERTALLSQQLAQQLAGFNTQQQSDIQAYIDQLRQQEYERATAAKQYADELQMRLYEYTQAAKKSSGGGGSSGGGSKAPAAATQPKANSFEEAYQNAVTSTPNSYSGSKTGTTKVTKEQLSARRGDSAKPATKISESAYKARRGF